jgi:cell division protease FtsH
LLGGRAAEEIIFGDISTGAHNDLAKATTIAASMVKEYGMSAKVGQVYFSREKQSRFLNLPDFQSPAEYSQATAEMIDAEVRDIISAQYDKAVGILRKNESALRKSAALLLEKETIDGTQLAQVMSEAEETNG